MLNSPLAFVFVPKLVPFTTTEAPATAAPSLSVTVPVTVLLWAKMEREKNRKMPVKAEAKSFFLILQFVNNE